MFPGFRVVAASFILASTMFLACSTNPTEPAPHPIPVVDSPTATVERLRTAWEGRSFDSYRTLFTDDFVFAFAALDTNGNRWRSTPWSRDNELTSFSHLISGGGVEASAGTIRLVLDRTLSMKSDPRPGKGDSTIHRMVTSQCNLSVYRNDGRTINISGKFSLYLVRGDAAAIPADLGRTADSTAWYIERWEDQTWSPFLAASMVRAIGSRPAAAQPSMAWTWGSLKALYLESAPAAAAIAPRP